MKQLKCPDFKEIIGNSYPYRIRLHHPENPNLEGGKDYPPGIKIYIQ